MKKILKSVSVDELMDYIEFERKLKHKVKDYDDLLKLNREDGFEHTNNFLIMPTKDVCVGFISSHKNNSEHLSYLYVSPFYRGMGYASKAVKEIDVKNVCTLPGNTKAIEFYKKNGFSINKDEGDGKYVLMERIK